MSGAPLVGPVHVRHHRPSRHTDLDDATNRILREALPGGAYPAWDVWLIEDPADDARFRVCYRVHHGVLDGVGAANVGLALLADRAVLGPRPHHPALPTPRGALATVAGVALSRRRVPHWAELPTERPPNGHFLFRDVPEQLARTLAEAYGTSVNDVSLAALAQALRAWRLSSTAAEKCPDILVLVPMTLRDDRQAYAVGDHFTTMRLRLPCSAGTFGEALRRVHHQTGNWRRTRARDGARLAIKALPRRFVGQLCDSMAVATTAPVTVSSISLPTAFTCHGASLHAAAMLSSLHRGSPTYVSLTRAAGIIRCALHHAESLRDPSTITRWWEQEIRKAWASQTARASRNDTLRSAGPE
ncbi:wax ester/triacylglycerol synthase domain-containing protein [Streptomyces sp. AK010]|uniref:wax ester/triacylglycerol synthase domain-containing protein n=1 Tax=Streptomyces sp. AK010 TaxID=2723074 RepID=UPI0021A9BD92|nr:wax ester/triacylglycerol synthase domain-containing protein [Streptomyces sp. AK010]